jgi:hypothetical protein
VIDNRKIKPELAPMRISPTTVTLIVGTLAFIGVVAAPGIAQWGAATLEDRRARTEIVLEMMRSNDREQMLQKLQVLVASGLLPDDDGRLRQAVAKAPVTAFEVVEVPVATHPLKPEDMPTPPAPLGPRPQTLSAAADALLSKECEWVAFGLKADPLLRVSAGMPQRALAKYPECEGRT